MFIDWSVNVVGNVWHTSVALKLAIGSVSTMMVALSYPWHPFISVTVRYTIYTPALSYWCVGFWAVEVFPSPNSHSHVSRAPPSGGTVVVRSVNVVGVPSHTVSCVNAATGPGFTSTGFVTESIHPYWSVMINCTLNVPNHPYWYDGFWAVDVPLVGVSPKLHCQFVIVPPSGVTIVDRSVNCVPIGPTHTVSAVNIASGLGLTTIVVSHVCVHPLSSVTVSVTVYSPGFAYVYVGFWVVDVPILSPKFHCHWFTVPDVFVDWSVNVVGNVWHTSVALKCAIGSVSTIIVSVWYPWHPFISVTVRSTIYIPAFA